MNWKVGDRARVNLPTSYNRHHGKVCQVISVGVPVIGCRNGDYIGIEVDLPCTANPNFELCVYRPQHLIPIDDGDEQPSWEAIEEITGWSPQELVTLDDEQEQQRQWEPVEDKQ